MRACCLVVWLVVGCYRPSELACNVRCDDTLTCPDDLMCSGIGELCAPIGESCASTDAAVAACPSGTTRIGSGLGLVELCVPSVMSGTQILNTQTIDTDLCTGFQLLSVGDSATCVIAADSISIVGLVKATGINRLIIAAVGTLEIQAAAQLTVASVTDPVGQDVAGAGALAPMADCATPPGGNAKVTGMGGGGGPGGRFADQPPGDGGTAQTAQGGVISSSDIDPAFRAGCRGGRGGDSGGGSGVDGGDPGGAVYLIGDAILVQGVINASGAGGRSAPKNTGGTGGGSGGFIGFDARDITIEATAQVFALGGGGSTGGLQAVAGGIGKSPLSATGPAPSTAAACGGTGSNGSSRGSPGGNGAPPNGSFAAQCGGGGGGGGSGRIMYIGTLTDLAGNGIAPAFEKMPL